MAVPIKEVEPNESGCIYQVSGGRGEMNMEPLSKRRNKTRREEPLKAPPGFHFKPTDSELAFGYLLKKLRGEPIPYDCIREVDVYEFHPQRIFEQNKKWEAEGKSYFFSTRTLKYPNGDRPARHTADRLGYWKATGSDKRLPEKGDDEAVWSQAETASRKTLVYYAGKAPNGTRTEWIMHEYVIDADEEEKERRKSEREAKKARERLQKLSNYEQRQGVGGECMKMDGWALCAIMKKRVSDAEGRGGDQVDNPCRKKPRRENNNNSPAASEAGADANDEHNGEANLQIVAQVDTDMVFPVDSGPIVSPSPSTTPLLDDGWDPNSCLDLESMCDEDSNALEQLYTTATTPLPLPVPIHADNHPKKQLGG